ncbi:hypothetical protein SUDANB6_02163 [Streptomyces sp. enrichment culture]|uniref:cytidylyl-2-hydroxypropylphosphonate hydrolase n=1 Tax=Streptomyces sp. enrichment culture TaxID=1795815 RepID=UPI003F57DE71
MTDGEAVTAAAETGGAAAHAGGTAAGAADAAARAGGAAASWAPGSQILWRYRENGGPRIHIARPVTVVRDDADLLAVWMAPGTECVKPALADGTPVHHEPLASRYTKPRTVLRDRWFGTGVLKLARPGEPWSVWLFWEPGWRFKNWYVNLEEPLARWSGGVDSEDHFLDISVQPDGRWHWRDEDEFAQAQRDGLMDAALAERVRRAGRSAVEVIDAWGPPFCDGWQDWRPDPSWPVPSLPEDWDRTPAHVSS